MNLGIASQEKMNEKKEKVKVIKVWNFKLNHKRLGF